MHWSPPTVLGLFLILSGFCINNLAPLKQLKCSRWPRRIWKICRRTVSDGRRSLSMSAVGPDDIVVPDSDHHRLIEIQHIMIEGWIVLQWSMLNRFRSDAGPCRNSMHEWCYIASATAVNTKPWGILWKSAHWRASTEAFQDYTKHRMRRSTGCRDRIWHFERKRQQQYLNVAWTFKDKYEQWKLTITVTHVTGQKWR